MYDATCVFSARYIHYNNFENKTKKKYCNIVFPFSVEDNSKEGNDGKSNVKNTNNFVHTEKSNGNGSKTNCTDGSAEQNNKDCPNSNYCDRVIGEAGSEIKVEIKSDPDAPSTTVQPAFGSELLPLHANSKHPVST